MSDKIINLFDLEKLLEKNLPKSIVEYYQSAARDEVTLKKIEIFIVNMNYFLNYYEMSLK